MAPEKLRTSLGGGDGIGETKWPYDGSGQHLGRLELAESGNTAEMCGTDCGSGQFGVIQN